MQKAYIDILSSKFAHDMSGDFGIRQRAKISILRPTPHFRVYFSLALLICRLGLSRSLSLLLSATVSVVRFADFALTGFCQTSTLTNLHDQDSKRTCFTRNISSILPHVDLVQKRECNRLAGGGLKSDLVLKCVK